jgi:hypothetical protein
MVWFELLKKPQYLDVADWCYYAMLPVWWNVWGIITCVRKWKAGNRGIGGVESKPRVDCLRPLLRAVHYLRTIPAIGQTHRLMTYSDCVQNPAFT